MKKVTPNDVKLIARGMNMKAGVVEKIIEGMLYNSYAELVMAVMICQKPLPLPKNEQDAL